jgi:hypothetical protein
MSDWTPLPKATDRVLARTGLSGAAANMCLVEAFAAGLMRTRWEAFVGDRGAGAGSRPAIERRAWAGGYISEADLMISADGTCRRGITVDEADLSAWLETLQYGPTTMPINNGRRETAEEACLSYIKACLAERPRPAREQLKARAHDAIRDLSAKEFNRAWASVPKEMKKPIGRPPKNPSR